MAEGREPSGLFFFGESSLIRRLAACRYKFCPGQLDRKPSGEVASPGRLAPCRYLTPQSEPREGQVQSALKGSVERVRGMEADARTTRITGRVSDADPSGRGGASC